MATRVLHKFNAIGDDQHIRSVEFDFLRQRALDTMNGFVETNEDKSIFTLYGHEPKEDSEAYKMVYEIVAKIEEDYINKFTPK